MFIERIVYSCLCIALIFYTANKFRKTKGTPYIVFLGFQVMSILIQILSLIKGVYPNYAIQAFIFITSIFIPASAFILEYLDIDLQEFIDVALGDIFVRRLQYNKAIEFYSKATERNPKNASAFIKLANAHNAIGDRRTAFDRFAKAVELDRNDYKSYYEIGIIFNELNKKSDAQVVLDNALRIKPDFTPASELLALVLCAQNKYDEAIHVYKDAIKYAPDNYQLYYSLGIVRTELRDFAEALECYKKAIELEPTLFEAYFSIGQIHLLRGELDEAAEAFKSAAQSKEIAAKAYYQLAKICTLKANEIEAISYIEYAIEIEPSYRYKAEKEPMFQNIKDYLTGVHMVSQAQMKLEKAIDEKVKLEYEKAYEKEEPVSINMDDIEIQDVKEEEVEFNFMDKFNSND